MKAKTYFANGCAILQTETNNAGVVECLTSFLLLIKHLTGMLEISQVRLKLINAAKNKGKLQSRVCDKG